MADASEPKKAKVMKSVTLRVPRAVIDEMKAQADKHGVEESMFMRWAIVQTTRAVRDGDLKVPQMRPDMEVA